MNEREEEMSVGPSFLNSTFIIQHCSQGLESPRIKSKEEKMGGLPVLASGFCSFKHHVAQAFKIASVSEQTINAN
jgi:hypothetical protein